jgi:hypothetical protein
MRFVLMVILIAAAAAAEAQQPKTDNLAPLAFMLGEWEGTSRGESGEGKVRRTCQRVLNDRFIECRTTVTYAKEVHNDVGYYSYDKAAKKLRLRQFHGEGFMNSYLEGEPLVFTTTEIENIPSGWRARETYERVNEDEWRERFELAQPGKDFATYTSSTLKRVQ